MGTSKELTAEEQDKLLNRLRNRFEKNMKRHAAMDWADVQARLEASPDKLWSLNEMEASGGDPDVVGHEPLTGEYLFVDCAKQSPQGRRSVCYDREALESRKEHKPRTSAIDMATEMGIALLTEQQYRDLQRLGEFDTSTSSWVQTPSRIRERGGAIFADRRFDTVFIYHNGADSYYAARGFRGLLRV